MSLPTPFEATGELTSLESADSFLAAVASQTGRIGRFPIGSSAHGRPLEAVTVGAHVPTRLEESLDPLLIVASQHGSEPAPREAAFALIRDLAFTADQGLLPRPVVVIHTANPDGIIASSRENGAGQDPNRHHADLAAPEAFAIQQTITRINPCLVVDAHEYTVRGSGAAVDLKINNGRYGESFLFGPESDALESAIRSAYPPGTTGTYTDTPHEGLLSSVGPARGILTLTVEVHMEAELADRVADHITAMHRAVQYSDERFLQLLATREAVRADHAAQAWAEGAHGWIVEEDSQALPILAALGATVVAIGAGMILIPRAQNQAPIVEWVIDTHPGIPVGPDGGAKRIFGRFDGETVPMEFPGAARVTLMLDGERQIVWGV